MADVRRGNVILTVSDEEVAKYMAKGYSLIDPKTGAVIKQSIPTELNQLQKAYSEHEEIIKKLNSEIASLHNQIKSLKTGVVKTPAQKDKETSTDDWDDWGSAEELDDKPKKKKRKNLEE